MDDVFASTIEFVQLAFRHDERARAVRNVGALGFFSSFCAVDQRRTVFPPSRRFEARRDLAEAMLGPPNALAQGQSEAYGTRKRVEVPAWLTSSVVNDLAKAMKALDGKKHG